MKDKRNKVKKILQGRGFYVTLALTLLATGIAGWLGAYSFSENNENNGGEKIWQNADTAQSDVQKESSSSQKPESSQSAPSSALSSSQSSSQPLPAQAKLLYILPCVGKISWDYSREEPVYSKTMKDYRLHTGIDIEADAGREVKASADGVIKARYEDPMWGNVVEIEHPDGKTSIYANLSDSCPVKKGSSVKAGDIIGTVGKSADIEIAEPSHLHFAIRDKKGYIDPIETVTLFDEND